MDKNRNNKPGPRMAKIGAQQGQAGMVMNQEHLAELERLAAYFEEDFQPCNDWLLIKVESQTVTKGGIALPDGVKAQTEPDRAVVIRTGPGVKDEDGKLIPMKFLPGDVVYPVFTGMRPAMQFQLGPICYYVAAAECLVGVSMKHNDEARVKELVNA